MKTSRVTLLALSAAAAACTTTPAFQEGPDAEVTFDGLTRVEGTVMDMVWARRDIDLSSFRKVMVTDVEFEYRPVSGPVGGREGASDMRRSSDTEFQIGPNTMAVFEAEIQGAFVEALGSSDRYEITDHPGPDVLMVRPAILDVVSRVPPEPVSRGTVYIDRVGEATLVIELVDSVSNTVFARAVDWRAAESAYQLQESSTVRNRAEVRRLGQRWGRILRNGLEQLLAEPAPAPD